MSKLQDEIMSFLFQLQEQQFIYISNNDEASELGEQIWNVLKGKEQ